VKIDCRFDWDAVRHHPRQRARASVAG
jgi:hypothetical protein